ncbi:MAG: hypothetical protein R3E95_03795 [Thiolinea sp.]
MEFRSNAPHGEVCDFLNTWNARIVSGPDGQNMFTVEMQSDSPTDAVALAEHVMQEADRSNAPVVFVGAQYQGE